MLRFDSEGVVSSPGTETAFHVDHFSVTRVLQPARRLARTRHVQDG